MVGFLLATFGVLFGAGSMEVSRFERRAAGELKTRLRGPNAKVQVKSELNGVLDGPLLGDLKRVTIRASQFETDGLPLFTEPDRSQRGRVRELNLELRDFKLAGLRIEALSAKIPECRYDFGLATRKKQIRLSRSGVGEGWVEILERDLADFVLFKFREIKRVEIRAEADKVFVKGYGEFLLLATEFEVIARLESPDGSTLRLAQARVWFDGKRAEPKAAEALLRTLNPVVDLDADLKLFGAIEIEGVRLRHGRLRAWGKTRIPTRPLETGLKSR